MTHQMSQRQKPFRLAVVLVMMIGAIEIRSVVSFNIPAFADASAETTEAPYYTFFETTPTEEDITVLNSTITFRFGKKTETTERNPTTDIALSVEESNSLGKLDDTSATIQATQLFLYRQKSQMSLKSLNKSLPTLESTQKNKTDLLNSTSADLSSLQPMSQSYATYKQADVTPENKLTQAEEKMNWNRKKFQRYVQAYRGVERELAAVNRTLGNKLLPLSNLFQTLGKFNMADKTDISPTLPTPSLRTTTSRSDFIITTDDYQWKHTDGAIPFDAVEGGTEGGAKLYIIRGYYEGSVIAGKFHSGSKKAYIGYRGYQVDCSRYEFLTGPPGLFSWVPRTGYNIPGNAIFAGNDVYFGNKVYIGRCRWGGEWRLGAVTNLSNALFFYTHDSEENTSTEFEVLVRK